MRLFIALEIPDPVVAELIGWRDPIVAAREGLRSVTKQSLHLTLAFLGDVEHSKLDAVGGALDVLSGAGQVPLALGAPFWLPRRRPGVLTVAVDDDERTLRDLQGLLVSALRQRAGLEPEGRIFFPHITVARVRGGAKVRPAPLRGPPPVEFTGTRVTLYESAVGYRALHSIEL